MRKSVGLALGVLVAAATLSPASAEELQKLSIVVFGAPSLGAFLPPVIKAQKLDEKNGLSISFEERTPDAYTAQFNSGEFQLGGSASLLTVGLADIRGVKVTYLFNLFDFWGAVVTSKPDVKSLKDIEGKDLAKYGLDKPAIIKLELIGKGGKPTDLPVQNPRADHPSQGRESAQHRRPAVNAQPRRRSDRIGGAANSEGWIRPPERRGQRTL